MSPDPTPVPTPATPATPAAQPTSATSATPALPMDTLVPVIVDGKRLMEPLSKVVANYQMGSAAEARLTTAKKMGEEYRQQIELAKFLDNTLATQGPEAAVREFTKITEKLAGRPLRLDTRATPSQDPSAEDAPPADANTARLQAELDSVRGELAKVTTFQRNLNTEREATAITRALSEYQTYQQDPELRQRAALLVGAMKEAFPNRPVDEVIAEVHAQDVRVLENHVNRVRDNRQQRASATRTMNPAVGTPSLTTDKPMTYADFKKPGEFSRRVQDFANRWVNGEMADMS